MRSILLSGFALFAAGALAAPFKLTKDDVVAFLGGTDMVRAQQSGHLESLLTWAHAEAPPRFRDMAWEADTVFALGTETERWRRDGFRGINGLGNLEQQLERNDISVVIVQLGKSEAFAGRDGLERFNAATDKLFNRLKAEGRRLVVVSPAPFEKALPPLPDNSRRNADLKLYVDALSALAKKHEAPFINLFADFPAALTDGLHVRPEAQATVAIEIAAGLGVRRARGFDGLEDLRKAVREKHRLWRSFWRPANWKCIFGDDNRRVFSVGRGNVPNIRDEWSQLPALVAKAEEQIVAVANGRAKPKLTPQPKFPERKAVVDPAEELKAFRPAEGFAVNLFASEKLGIANPLTMRWDAKGRMYVACTWAYPHLRPGEIPNDIIIQLTDTDGDGRADKSTVFADGLNIPTGLETGDGGVYVGTSEELLFLRDIDDDGVADERRVLLSGFGTGDSHQAINSFTWSPDGELFFCQGDGIESRVETPWGISGLYQAGVHRVRPRTLQHAGLLDDNMGPGNPWGVAFDDWGQSVVVDGAGGVSYLTPGSIPAKHRKRLPRIGNPGGYCGVEMLNGRQMPEAMRGHFVLNDFKSNRVKRFKLHANGAGYRLEWLAPVLESGHRNFRPVDVRIGPDGALYIADFYNPIICHQDDYFRDPTRDFHHGRIWRLTAKSNPAAPMPKIVGAETKDLLELLKSPERWTRQKAKDELALRPVKPTAAAIVQWAAQLDAKDPRHDHHLLEALAACAKMESVQPTLLDRVLRAKDPRARAFAARIAGRWDDRLPNADVFLARAANDEHPQVRMEAILACGQSTQPTAIRAAAEAVTRHARDGWIDYAFTQAVHHHERHWRPALTEGRLDFGGDVQSMAAVLEKRGSRDLLNVLLRLAKSPDIDATARHGIFNGIASIGGPNELRAIFEKQFHAAPASQAAAFVALRHAAAGRNTKPAGDLIGPLKTAVTGNHPKLQSAALTLAGQWKVGEVAAEIRALAKAASLPVQIAALNALGQLGKEEALLAEVLADSKAAGPLRVAALDALSRVNLVTAVLHGTKMLMLGEDAAKVLPVFLAREGGPQVLAASLEKAKLTEAIAAKALAALRAAGSSDAALTKVLSKAAGVAATGPVYSEKYVRDLARESLKGNAANGAVVFQTAGCAACHQSGKPIAGLAYIGPDLSTIGNTLSRERIIEEVLWPARAVKEGYSLVQVTTADGTIHQGYEQRSRADDVFLTPLGSRETLHIPAAQVREKKSAGTAMPPNLTATLRREQLQDLIHFLTQSRGGAEGK